MTKRSVTKKPKLTKWFDGSKFVPYHVGEYNASIVRDKSVFRWWNGSCWSLPYEKDQSEEDKTYCRSRTTFLAVAMKIDFRGLAQNPEVQP